MRYITTILGNRDSVVGTATIYNWLEDPWVECRRGKETFLFSVTSRPVLGPTQRPIKWVPRLIPGSKATGA